MYDRILQYALVLLFSSLHLLILRRNVILGFLFYILTIFVFIFLITTRFSFLSSCLLLVLGLYSEQVLLIALLLFFLLWSLCLHFLVSEKCGIRIVIILIRLAFFVSIRIFLLLLPRRLLIRPLLFFSLFLFSLQMVPFGSITIIVFIIIHPLPFSLSRFGFIVVVSGFRLISFTKLLMMGGKLVYSEKG